MRLVDKAWYIIAEAYWRWFLWAAAFAIVTPPRALEANRQVEVVSYVVGRLDVRLWTYLVFYWSRFASETVSNGLKMNYRNTKNK